LPALNTDKARKAAPLFATTLSAPILATDTTIPLQSVTGLPLDTAVTITIDATDSSGNPTPTVKETMTGVVNTGSVSLVNAVRGLDSTTAQAHASGAAVVQWFTADDWNDFISSYLTEHVQLGHHQSLNDINGNAWISQTATASAVNNLNVANSVSGSPIILSAVGTDTNIDIDITPKGTGKVVAPNGTISSAALTNPCKFLVYLSSVASTSSNTPLRIPFDTKVFDTGNNVDVITNKGRFTASIAGFYDFTAQLSFEPYNPDIVYPVIYKNGVNLLVGNEQDYTNTNTHALNITVPCLQLAVNDYIDIYIIHTTAGNMGVQGTGIPYQTWFGGLLVSQT
jgi:hypothetical protein